MTPDTSSCGSGVTSDRSLFCLEQAVLLARQVVAARARFA